VHTLCVVQSLRQAVREFLSDTGKALLLANCAPAGPPGFCVRAVRILEGDKQLRRCQRCRYRRLPSARAEFDVTLVLWDVLWRIASIRIDPSFCAIADSIETGRPCGSAEQSW
jgi:hypothetical protein